MVPIEALLTQYLILSNADALLFGKFFSPVSTWTVQNSLDNADALLQDCPPPLIYLTTNSTGTYSISLWLAFLTSVQQGKALKCASVVLNGTSKHCHAYWNIPEAFEVGTPLY